MKVDPHILGLAIMDLLARDVITEHAHSGVKNWYAYKRIQPEPVAAKLAAIAPVYRSISQGDFPNKVGDALEIILLKTLQTLRNTDPRFNYLGSFLLDRPKNAQGRYVKVEPPQTVSGGTTKKQADFMLMGFEEGIISIECKNYREWLYPSHTQIRELIIKSYETNTLPLLVQRRIHYSTISNFLVPAGIMAHETLLQYYPEDEVALAEDVKRARGLGFTDVTASYDPHDRTKRFFTETLPKIVPSMAGAWAKNRDALYDFALGKQNIAQLYTSIGSPAGGKWKNFGEEASLEGHEE